MNTEHVRYNLSAEVLEAQVLAPYREGRALMSGGAAIQVDDISQIRIVQTDRLFGDIRCRPHSLIGRSSTRRPVIGDGGSPWP